MNEIFYIFVGGGTGSVLRYFISMLWRHLSLHPSCQGILFPWPTFVANIIGCFLIGLFYQCSDRWGLTPEARLMLTTGLCGGFTTFSTFSYEGISLIMQGYYGIFALYILMSIAIGIGAVALPY